jgi:diguanylate cyclase (GGDEF)-like protein
MCDIDYFKNVNDTYGHDVGDFTIREVSKCIRNNLRKDDIAVRWGGEEFFIYLSEVNMDNAYRVSEKLRECMETFTMHYDDNIKINVTMSIGISIIDHKNTLEMATSHADSAMYISKQKGRNRSTKYIENI